MLYPERIKNAKAFTSVSAPGGTCCPQNDLKTAQALTSVSAPGGPCCSQNDLKTAEAFTSVSELKRLMLRPE